MTEGSSKLWRGAVMLAALCCAAPPAPGLAQVPADRPASEAAQIAERDLRQIAAVLNNPDAPQEQRDEAARRLLSRQTPAARRLVAEALVNLNPGGQLAAARAMAGDPNPDPAMINPLFAALGANRALTDAAARALSNYKDRPEVVTRMITYVRGRAASESARAVVVRALGSLPEKRSAEFLVSLLNTPSESATVREAASAALSDLTGLPNGSRDPRRWSEWWEENRAKTEDGFRSDLMAVRSARYDRLRAEFDGLAQELEVILEEQYRGAPAEQRPQLLLRYLGSAEPQVRAAAAGIVFDEAQVANPPPPNVRERLRDMIGDSSASVRVAVAEALSKINDAAAFEALLAQLAQEPDPRVRAALASAVAPINDVRAVPLLVAMLSDPSYTAARAAADALQQLGPTMRESNSILAQQTAAALRETLLNRTGTPETADFRARLVAAMVPLRQRELLPLLTDMLNEQRGESVEVRRLAIAAIGEIGEPQSAGVLLTAMGDRSERIRLEAVQALAKNPSLAENALALRPLLDQQQEPDENVRLAAWRALETVFPTLPKAQLASWADRLKGDPAKRLIALKALAQQQLRDKDEDGLATTRLDIAALLTGQREFKEAAEYYGMALEYKKTQAVPGAVIESLRHDRMSALLSARDYANAVTFAAQSIQESPGNAQLMGALIWNEAQRLSQAEDFGGALELITATAKMSPPLTDEYREKLAAVEKQVQARMSQQNGAPSPPGPRSASGTITPAPNIASAGR